MRYNLRLTHNELKEIGKFPQKEENDKVEITAQYIATTTRKFHMKGQVVT
jgi:hypothetical protein